MFPDFNLFTLTINNRSHEDISSDVTFCESLIIENMTNFLLLRFLFFRILSDMDSDLERSSCSLTSLPKGHRIFLSGIFNCVLFVLLWVMECQKKISIYT